MVGDGHRGIRTLGKGDQGNGFLVVYLILSSVQIFESSGAWLGGILDVTFVCVCICVIFFSFSFFSLHC